MNKPVRNLIAGGMLAVALLGGGAAATAQASTTTTTTASSDAPKAPSKADRAQHEAQRNADLAKALGVSTDKVTAAEKAARAAVDDKYGKPTRPNTKPTTKPAEPTAAQKAEMKARHDLFENTFAKELGVTPARLKAAMITVEKAHLAAEVKAGHLTQAQADERIKAIEDGTAPMGRPGGPGHGGPGHGGPGHGGPGHGGPGHGGPGGPPPAPTD